MKQSADTGKPGEPALNRVDRLYREKFGGVPVWRTAAPGRVNLIGEHTDYNDGFALPMAIDRYTVVAGGFSATGRTTVFSEQLGQLAELWSGEIETIESGAWSRYVGGVLHGFESLGHSIPALNLVVCSDVPTGGGVSSSAALEVATACLVQQVLKSSLDGMEIAKLCQQAEHEYAGVPCGVMDQISSVFGRAGNLMLLDCRSLEIEHLPMSSDDVAILVVNSNVRHSLVDGEYRARREQCGQAATSLGVSALRDVSPERLDQSKPAMPELIFRRARHVISEIQRTLEAAEMIRQREWKTVGRLMYASHESLRDDYEVTCRETDLLIELARAIGLDGGVFGSRMTGGGFGGCTVSLVRRDRAEATGQVLKDRYFEQTGIVAEWFVTAPADGALAIATNRSGQIFRSMGP